VGQTFDVGWRPGESGVYVLEIVTRSGTPNAPPVTRRVPFVVGDVAEEEIREAMRIPWEAGDEREGNHAQKNERD